MRATCWAATRPCTLLLAVFSVGIGLGALACERLSGHKVEIGLVPFGSIGMTVFLSTCVSSRTARRRRCDLDVGAVLSARWRVIVLIAPIGVFGGFFSCRCTRSSRAQRREPPRAHHRRNNILNASSWSSPRWSRWAPRRRLHDPAAFPLPAVLNAAVAAYIYPLVPEFLMRFISGCSCTRVPAEEARAREHPGAGPALLICNHVSFVDALVIWRRARAGNRWGNPTSRPADRWDALC